MAGRGGKRENAGRRPGAKNKATVKREELARLEHQASAARTRVEIARGRSTRFGKDVLEEFMVVFAGMAAAYQPVPPGQPVPTNRKPDEDKFLVYAKLAVDTAADLANFQSPKFRAIAVMAPPPVESAPLPGDGAKVVDLATRDPQRAADTLRRFIAQSTGAKR